MSEEYNHMKPSVISIADLQKENIRLTSQRDELAEKINQAIPYINASTHGGAKAIRILEAAIKKGGAA